MAVLGLLALFATLCVAQNVTISNTTTSTTTTPDLCTCGYYDAATDQLYTESIVVYFNETLSLPADTLEAQSWVHKKESGWTTIYRQGATPFNVLISNTSEVEWLEEYVNSDSLELSVSPYTAEHLVDGSAITTFRRDILFGSFRARVRSPHQWAGGGTALSMMLPFNQSDVIELDLLNTDSPDTARVTTLMNGEYASSNLGVNYTTIEQGGPDIAPVAPWDFMEVRIDWTQDQVNWTIGGNVTRSVNKTHTAIPVIPVPLVFKHWSTGDKDFMQGPPTNVSVANVQWIRAFFNSSTMTAQQHAEYNAQCQPSLACSMDDNTLRGSSEYAANATVPYSEPQAVKKLHLLSAIVSASFGSIGVLAIVNGILRRRVPWHKMSIDHWTKRGSAGPGRLTSKQNLSYSDSTLMHSGSATPDSWMQKEPNSHVSSTDATAYNTRAPSLSGFSSSLDTTACNTRAPSPTRCSIDEDQITELPKRTNFSRPQPFSADKRKGALVSVSSSSSLSSLAERTPEEQAEHAHGKVDYDVNVIELSGSDDEKKPYAKITPVLDAHEWSVDAAGMPGDEDTVGLRVSLAEVRETEKLDENDHRAKLNTTSNFHTGLQDDSVLPHDPILAVSVPAPAPPEAPTAGAPQNVRIDYLAGLVAFSCFCVSMVHFVDTFLPSVTQWGNVQHYSSELWGKKTIGSFLLTEAWIGPFFTTSARFLSARYFRNGKLSDVANKILLRAPRMIVPIVLIAGVEYFFLEMGAQDALTYLPSISFSTWPYVVPYANFGGYINSLIDLAYTIPNVAPQIIPHYCVGVLWTIPVQLQFSYTVLLGAVMVREIKTPWKRFCFYAFCIINSWYAFSWGSCFWIGLMLSDLSVTYKYGKWIHDRPVVHYSVLTGAWLTALACCSIFIVANDANYDFLTPERGIHIDPPTGMPIRDTASNGYPNYYEPRLNTIVLAGVLQLIVELSSCVQWFLSLKCWTMIFPHIMTIYLMHGLIFWTLGAFVCVELAVLGVPYWANMLVTWMVCYGTLALVVMFVTPITDFTAKRACKNIWRWASETPVPKRPTTAPYGKGLILDRKGSSGVPWMVRINSRV